MPQDKVFYTLFDKAGTNVQNIALLLYTIVHESDPEKKESIFKEIKKIERENDDLTQEVIVELSQNFITPFDREDIHALSTALDEIINLIYATAKKMKFYNLDTSEPDILDSIPPILDSTEAVKLGISALRSLKNTDLMQSQVKTINKAEKKADALFDSSINSLFQDTEDIKKLIKMREVYQYLESITDQCRVAGKILESISIKYA